MSIVGEAYALRRRCRDEFELYLETMFVMAHEECAGVLVNRKGKAAGVDPRSLFLGSADRANLYASPELLAFWERRRRLNYRMFEEQWTGRDQEYDVI